MFKTKKNIIKRPKAGARADQKIISIKNAHNGFLCESLDGIPRAMGLQALAG